MSDNIPIDSPGKSVLAMGNISPDNQTMLMPILFKKGAILNDINDCVRQTLTFAENHGIPGTSVGCTGLFALCKFIPYII